MTVAKKYVYNQENNAITIGIFMSIFFPVKTGKNILIKGCVPCKNKRYTAKE